MSFYYQTKLQTNRIIRSGLSFIIRNVRLRDVATAALSFTIIGICHLTLGASAYSGMRADLSAMSKPQMFRYAVSVQTAASQNPDVILSLSADDVKLMLAAPDLNRRDGAGAVWQYRTASCVLDVFMDEDQIKHYEFRSRRLGDEAVIDAPSCLKDLYTARRSLIAQAFEEVFAAYVSAKDAG